MKKTKKLVSFLLILWTLWVSYVSANYESRRVAENYIKEMENFWPFWKWKKPTIVKETPFYTYDDKNVSYMEYKVSCNDDVDCGFIMVNTDKSDVSIPMSSTTWKSLSEQMDEKNIGKNKNYYFDVFNHFAITNTWKIKTTSPENEVLDNGENIYTRSIDKNPLYEKFKKIQKVSKENKEKYIKNQEMKKYTERSVNPVFNLYSWVINNNFFDKEECKSLTPCYKQLNRRYWSLYWLTWCTSVAFSILYWFYDKYWYPNLIEGDTPSLTTSEIKSLQIKIWNDMWTLRLNDWSWLTLHNRTIDWFKYLNWKYANDWWIQISYVNDTFHEIKREIMNWRPVLLSYTWHIVVVHWYIWNRLAVNLWHWRDFSNVLLDVNWNNISWNSISWIKEIKYIYTLKLF